MTQSTFFPSKAAAIGTQKCMLKLTGPRWMTNCSYNINDIIVKFDFRKETDIYQSHEPDVVKVQANGDVYLQNQRRYTCTYRSAVSFLMHSSPSVWEMWAAQSLACDNILLCKGWLVLPSLKYPDKEKRIWQLSEQHFIRSAFAKINQRQAEGWERAWKAGTSNRAPSQSLCLCRTCLLSPSHSKCQTYLF